MWGWLKKRKTRPNAALGPPDEPIFSRSPKRVKIAPNATDDSILGQIAERASDVAFEQIVSNLPPTHIVSEFILGYTLGIGTGLLRARGPVSNEDLVRVRRQVAHVMMERISGLLPRADNLGKARELAGMQLGSAEPEGNGRYRGLRTALGVVSPWVSDPRGVMEQHCYPDLRMPGQQVDFISETVDQMQKQLVNETR
jgi:hypothetical protein